jgi:hypothetical protein
MAKNLLKFHCQFYKNNQTAQSNFEELSIITFWKFVLNNYIQGVNNIYKLNGGLTTLFMILLEFHVLKLQETWSCQGG